MDTLENAQVMVEKSGATFDFTSGVTQAESDGCGAWWSEDRGGYIQPAEFLIGRGGVVLGSMYASGPVGRMGVDEAIRQITNRERRRREGRSHSMSRTHHFLVRLPPRVPPSGTPRGSTGLPSWPPVVHPGTYGWPRKALPPPASRRG